jgi:hypothetical protein
MLKVKQEQIGKGSVTHYLVPGTTSDWKSVDLDSATQDELKILFDYGHEWVYDDSAKSVKTSPKIQDGAAS